MREGRHFVLYVLHGEATLWHKLNVHELRVGDWLTIELPQTFGQ